MPKNTSYEFTFCTKKVPREKCPHSKCVKDAKMPLQKRQKGLNSIEVKVRHLVGGILSLKSQLMNQTTVLIKPNRKVAPRLHNPYKIHFRTKSRQNNHANSKGVVHAK